MIFNTFVSKLTCKIDPIKLVHIFFTLKVQVFLNSFEVFPCASTLHILIFWNECVIGYRNARTKLID